MKSLMKTAALSILTAAALSGSAIASNLAYIPLGNEDKLVIVDIETDAVIGKIEKLPAIHGLAATPDGRYLIAGSYDSREAGSQKMAKPAGVSQQEHEAHHKKPPAGTAKTGPEISTLTIIKTVDSSVLRKIDVPGAVHHVAVSPDNGFAVVTHPNEDKISVIDLKQFEVIASVATGPLPNYAAFSLDGSKVYVSNAGNNTISAVDVGKWIVNWNAVVGASPEHVVLSRDGATLYVNNVDDGTVTVVDVNQRKAVKTLPIGFSLHGIDLSDDGKALLVAARGGEKLVSIDLVTGTYRSSTMTSEPYHLSSIRGTGKIYVSSTEEPKIWVVDQKSLKVVGEIPIGGKGHQIVHVTDG